MITIKVNQQPQDIKEASSIIDLIKNLEINTNGIAIAINNKVIKKEDWENQELVLNDDVLIIKSTQGG